MNGGTLTERSYIPLFGAVALVAVLLAVGFRIQDLLLTGLTVGLYSLHLYSVRELRSEQEKQQARLEQVAAALEDLESGERPERSPPLGPDDEDDGRDSEQPAGEPRLRLETVALVEGMLEPGEVAPVLEDAEGAGGVGFGELARRQGYLTRSELQRLRDARNRERYSEAELSRARMSLLHRLKEAASG